MLSTGPTWGRLVKAWRIESRAHESLTAAQALARHFSTDPPDAPEKPSDGDKPVVEGAEGSQAAAIDAPSSADGTEASEQVDASPGPQSTTTAAESTVQPAAEYAHARLLDPGAPAAATIQQHFMDTQPHDHTVLRDSFLDCADGDSSEASTDAQAEPPRLTPLESELRSAVNDQYGQFGVTVEDLRTYLDVSLDIDDAVNVGRKPDIQPDRYKVYKRVDSLIKFGPEKSPEELDRLDRMAEYEMLNLPWPTTMVRNYIKEKHGVKLKRMKKEEMTRYDQGWMSDALLPFESEEEMAAHFFQEPDPKVASSFWEDEVDEDGNVKRSAERMAGTDDLTDWAQAVATAMITPVDPASLQHAMRGIEFEEDEEGEDNDSVHDELQTDTNEATDTEDASDIEAAAGTQLGGTRDQDLSNDDNDNDEMVEDEYAQFGPTMQFEDGQQYRHPDALGALMEAKFGEDKLYGLPEEERQRLNKLAAAAITEAAFKEQESSILRSHGYEADQREAFMDELGLDDDSWKDWVQNEVMQTLERLGNIRMDDRSPQDMMEEFVASHSLVAPWMGPANNLREVVEHHPIGPVSDYYIQPEHTREREEDREPASDYALWDSVIDGSKADLVYPEIFHFDQKIIMHFGEQPYHPANRRVTLRVHLKDLKLKYGLRDEAIIHIVTVAGKRYNPKNGVISITCDRHRAREENRRQALHWTLRLVESALLEHPSEEWERIKELQDGALTEVDEPAPCPFASFIDSPHEQSLGAEQPSSGMASS